MASENDRYSERAGAYLFSGAMSNHRTSHALKLAAPPPLPRSPHTPHHGSPTTTMGLIKFLFKTGFYTTCGAVGAFTMLTRKSKFTSLAAADGFKASYIDTYNPHGNPLLRERCVRSVRLDKIRPELLEEEGALVRAICAGVWSGKGTCS